MQRITISRDAIEMFSGRPTYQRFCALINMIGPDGEVDLFRGDSILDEDFEALRERFETLLQGSALPDQEQRQIQLLAQMVAHLRKNDYEVVFLDK